MNSRITRSLAGLVPMVTLIASATAQTCSLERVNLGPNSDQGDAASLVGFISADGRFVAFRSEASNLVPPDDNNGEDVFIRDRALGVTELVSVSLSGVSGDGDSYAYLGCISATGRYVAFGSHSDDLVPGDINDRRDVFVRDRESGTTERVSVNSAGGQVHNDSYGGTISADGRFVAFSSFAQNLAPGDGNTTSDVFVRDRLTGTTTLATLSTSGVQSNDLSYWAFISGDGTSLAFFSWADNLVSGDTNGRPDIFVRTLATGVTTRVSVASSGAQGNEISDFPSLSADGRYVSFMSFASNLAAGDGNGNWDTFVHDRASGATTCVSVNAAGVPGNEASSGISMSADGRWVSFASLASDLVPGDTNATHDVFVRDLQRATTERVSLTSSGTEANNVSYAGSISADGRAVAFWSFADNLVLLDTNGQFDIFVRECDPAEPRAFCIAKVNSQGCTPVVEFDGQPSASSPLPFKIFGGHVINNKLGLLFYGFAANSIPFQGGFLCVRPPLARTTPQSSLGHAGADDCSGLYTFDFNALIRSGVDPALAPNAVVHAQYWSRDPASPSTTGLTDALTFLIQP